MAPWLLRSSTSSRLSVHTAVVPQVLWWDCFQNSLFLPTNKISVPNLTHQNLKVGQRIVQVSSWEVWLGRVSEVGGFTITTYVAFFIILRHFSLLDSHHLVRLLMVLLSDTVLHGEKHHFLGWSFHPHTGLEEASSGSGTAPTPVRIAQPSPWVPYCTSWWVPPRRGPVRSDKLPLDSTAACAVTVPLIFTENTSLLLMTVNC